MKRYKYIPFLKLKSNEVSALSKLEKEFKEVLMPFFDIPTKKDLTSEKLAACIEKAAKKLARYLEEFPGFYLDNFDIADHLRIGGEDNYRYLIDKFKDLIFVPVVAPDRTAERNAMVFDLKKTGQIKSSTIAIRLQPEDFVHYGVVRKQILSFLNDGKEAYDEWVLIFDNRVCSGCDAEVRSREIASFIDLASKDFDFLPIVTGSSIPSSIADILKVGKEIDLPRAELDIWRRTVANSGSGIVFGDYTIVSPNYSDIDMRPEAMRNITVPKIVYTHGDVHFVMRGNGSLKMHPRSDRQYNDLAAKLIKKVFYRGPPFSWGDRYIFEKGMDDTGVKVTPGTILGPTINTHIIYMVKSV
jgi:hypothetical protein